jgi:hypothetical protein
MELIEKSHFGSSLSGDLAILGPPRACSCGEPGPVAQSSAVQLGSDSIARKRPIIARLVNFCWSCFKWCVTLAIVSALALAVYLYLQLDTEIRRQIEQRIAVHYPQFDVQVARARVVKDEGIELQGLKISDPTLTGPAATLLEVDQIMIGCATDLVQLSQGEPQVCGVTVRRPTLRATRLRDGTWSVARLLPLPRFGPRSPPVVIEQATVELFDHKQGQEGDPAPTVRLRGGNLKLTPATTSAGGQHGVKRLKFHGTAACDFVQRIEVDGLVEPATGRWQLRGTLDDVDVSPRLFRSLPRGLVTLPPNAGAYQGRASVRRLEIAYDPTGSPAWQFSATTDLRQGRWQTASLPEPLTDVSATIGVDNQGLNIENFVASYGTATLRLACQRFGWQPSAHLRITADAQRLQLNRKLFAALPASLRGLWTKFQPVGHANVALKLDYDGSRWHPDAVVRLTGASLSAEKFPYRIDRTTGTIRVKEKNVSFDLRAYSGSHAIKVDGQLDSPGPNWTGWARVRGREIDADKRLIAALPPRGRKVVESLHSSGAKFHFDWQCWRDEPGPPKPCQQLDLELVGGSICYEKFRYPLDNVRGRVEWRNNRWQLKELSAMNHMGRVGLSGRLVPVEAGHQLVLDIRANNVPIDDELRSALQPAVQRVWDDLKPKGRINLTAKAVHVTGQADADVEVVIQPVEATVSIDPVYFQYHLDQLQGAIKYHQGQVEWKAVQGRHGSTTIRSAARFQADPSGRWHIDFSQIEADRLRADRDLLAALPTDLRRAVSQLAPTGPINMNGSLSLDRGGPSAPVTSTWDLRFDVQQTNLNCGVQLDNVRGSVRIRGKSDGQRVEANGQLSLDSLNFNGFQFTKVRGPIWIEKDRVLLGKWVGRERKSTPQHLTATLHGGTLLADGWVTLGDRPKFALQAALSDGDLAQLAKENIRGRHHLKGKIYATASVEGTGQSVHTLTGSGKIHLRDADVYELPVVVSLLKVLSARLPDTSAFTESEMSFRIQGDHLYFDQLDLMGDAVNLYGKGTVDFQKNLSLVFHTNFRSSRLPLPLVRNVLGQASQQILQIHVDGTFDKANIRNEAFPAMNQALQQIQTDLGTTEQQPQRPTASRWLPWWGTQ